MICQVKLRQDDLHFYIINEDTVLAGTHTYKIIVSAEEFNSCIGSSPCDGECACSLGSTSHDNAICFGVFGGINRPVVYYKLTLDDCSRTYDRYVQEVIILSASGCHIGDSLEGDRRFTVPIILERAGEIRSTPYSVLPSLTKPWRA